MVEPSTKNYGVDLNVVKGELNVIPVWSSDKINQFTPSLDTSTL
jgi:hypothetical protein